MPQQKAAERILSHVKKYVEEKLFLKVNETKTKIVRAGNDTQFLGFAFTRSVAARRRKEYPCELSSQRYTERNGTSSLKF